MPPATETIHGESTHGEEGYMLLAVVLVVFFVLLTLSIAAPRMAMELKHDQEVETRHRAEQYVRAIRLYYRKTHNYPASIDVLAKQTNGTRYLRQKYLDPLTGKDDWRLILVGQNKSKVMGMFGQELPGLGGGLGSAAGLQSTTGGSTTGSSTTGASTTGTTSTSAFDNSGLGSNGSTGGSSTLSGASTGSLGLGSTAPGTTSQPGPVSSSFGSTSTGSGPTTGGTTSQSATDFQGGGGPIMGVGVSKSGVAMLTVNAQTNYQDWEFLYDPRTEPTGAQGMNSGTGTSNGIGGAPGTSSPTNPLSPTSPSSQNPAPAPAPTPTQPGTFVHTPGSDD